MEGVLMKTLNVIDDEIEKREIEKFELLTKSINETQSSLSDKEKFQFDSLWSYYCNCLEEIQNRNILKKQIDANLIIQIGTFNRKLLISFSLLVMFSLVGIFGDFEFNKLIYIFSLCICYLIYGKIQLQLNITENNIERKMIEYSVMDIKHNLSLKHIHQPRYQTEYLESCYKLYGGASDVDKAKFEKYKDLHFTYVTNDLLKIVKGYAK